MSKRSLKIIRSRRDVPEGENLCDYCKATCCRYFALPIDTPSTHEDFDSIRWYLFHKNATVFVEEKTWYLLIYADCKALDEHNRCTVYENRPDICRDYGSDKCEFIDDYVYEQYFETPEQIEEYAEALLGKRVRNK